MKKAWVCLLAALVMVFAGQKQVMDSAAAFLRAHLPAGEEAAPVVQEPVFEEPSLFIRYQFALTQQEARFTLQRTKKELDALLQSAEGVTLAVGLYQQLGSA